MQPALRRWTGTAKDPRGATVDTYADPVPLDCVIAPRSTSETADAGYENRVIDSITLLDVTTPIGPKDQVDLGDRTYEVEGLPFDWAEHDPFGEPIGGAQVTLKGVSG